MRRLRLALTASLLWIGACGHDGAGHEQNPVELQIGHHRVTMVLPADWEHLDYGETHQLRRDLAGISIADLDRMGVNLDEAAERAMAGMGEDDRRETAARRRYRIDGREALAIDTWNRLSHQYRRSYLFVSNERKLLAFWMTLGDFAVMEEAFKGLAASLAFVDTVGAADSGVLDREN